jgi:hypothetical protein
MYRYHSLGFVLVALGTILIVLNAPIATLVGRVTTSWMDAQRQMRVRLHEGYYDGVQKLGTNRKFVRIYMLLVGIAAASVGGYILLAHR